MFDAVARNVLVPLLLRAALGVIFIFHGLGKISKEGNEMGAAWLKAKPATPAGADSSATPASEPEPPPPAALQLAVAWGELIGGIALIVGFLTRVAALGIIVIMVGAIAKV